MRLNTNHHVIEEDTDDYMWSYVKVKAKKKIYIVKSIKSTSEAAGTVSSVASLTGVVLNIGLSFVL